MKLYLICTEWKPNLADLARQYCDCFMIQLGLGCYEGKFEHGAQIQVITCGASGKVIVERLAATIARVNEQAEVYVVELDCALTVIAGSRTDEQA